MQGTTQRDTLFWHLSFVKSLNVMLANSLTAQFYLVFYKNLIRTKGQRRRCGETKTMGRKVFIQFFTHILLK